MKQKLLDLMVCPHDHSALTAAGDVVDGEIREGEVRCNEGHSFPIREGVPRMISAEQAVGDSDQAGTHETFSSKWQAAQNEDWKPMFEFQHQWYERRYGFESEEAIGEFLSGQSAILDAGTGLGRDAARFARLSEGAEVVGMDLSEAVTFAHKEFGSLPNVHYVQGDILNPPFAGDTFSFVSSDQVIHHTPDAPRAFRTLADTIKDGGDIACYVYKVKAPMREYADDYIRERTTKMSVDDCMRFSEAITELGHKLSDLDAKITLEKPIPELGIEAGEHDVQRLIYWNFLKCFWNDDWSQEINVLTNFDWYHPPYASRHTAEEVRQWCADAGFEPTLLDDGDSGISVLAHEARAASVRA
jgi:SAM-dependent methyltransferase/uncharacterized protein YbaR (Trm112 family)